MSNDSARQDRYPFKKLEREDPPAAGEVATGDHVVDDSGAGRTVRVPAAFEARERAGAIDDPLPSKGQAERMLYDAAGKGVTSKEVLDDAVAQVRRRTNKTTLEQMRFVANEVGRRRGGGKLLHRTVTQQLVDELIGDDPEASQGGRR